MRKVKIPLWLAIVLIALAGTSQWWISAVLAFLQKTLSFINTNSNLIQGLADFVQIILWIFTAAIALFSIIQRKFPPSIPLPWGHRNPYNHSRSPINSSEEIAKLKEILYYICNLHRTDYVLNDWKKTYIINEQGDVEEKEEISIAPLPNQDKVFFWLMVRGVYLNTVSEALVEGISAKNKGNKQELEIVEISRELRRIMYVIILDPPATDQNPVQLEIKSSRPGIFKPLIDNLKDTGGFQIEASRLDNAEVKIILSDSMEVTSFSISPNVGSSQINEEGGRSCLTWTATNLQRNTYTYVIQAKRK